MRVLSEKQRAGRTLTLAVLANRLRDGKNMVLVERGLQRRSAMTRGSKRDFLCRLRDVGLLRVVSGNELRDVNQHVRGSKFSSARIDRHSAPFSHSRVRFERPKGGKPRTRDWVQA